VTLQAAAGTRIQALPRTLVRVETVSRALVCIQTVLPMTSLPSAVKIISADIVLATATHVSTRPATTAASCSVNCVDSTTTAAFPASAFTAASFMLVARGS
jgi:hypothetical protein